MKDLLSKISQKKIAQYQAHLEKLELSEATIKRRLSTLRKFCDWAKKEGYLEETPRAKIPVSKKIPSYKGWSFEKLTKRLRPSLPPMPTIPYISDAYEVYQSISITKYLHYAILVIFCVALGMGLYNQLTGPKAELAGAYPTALTRPKRYLSFQGRLTDSSNNPITSATNFEFKLWDQLSGGTEGTCTGDTGEDCLWKSGTCSIDPDQDGIFSVILGTTSGDGYTCSSAEEIDASVFTENAQIWLEVKVGTETLDPRIQVATVGYALNAETLQGYPPGTAASNIPYINDSGDVVIAAASPTLQSTSGTFAIEGNAGLTLQTASASNANITIAPDGTGVLNINLGGASGNQVRVTDANITSGALVSAYAGTTATGFDLLNLSSGSTETTKFSVDESGNTYVAGNLGVGTTNPGAKLDVSGNVKIGTVNNVSDNSQVLTVDSGIVKYIDTTNWDKDSGDDYGAWWLTGDSGTPQSIGAGDTVSLVGGIGIGTTSSATDTLTINVDESYGFAWTGTQSYSASDLNFTNATSFTMDTTGDLIFDADGGDILFSDAGSYFGGWNAGNFGIGTTGPGAKLDIVDNTVTTGKILSLSSTSITSGDILYLANNTANNAYLIRAQAGSSLSNRLTLDSNGNLKIYDTNGTNSLDLAHDGTNATITASSGNIEIGSGGGDFLIGESGTAVDIHFAESANIEADAGKVITMTDIGNITPDATNQYDLGSDSLRWQDIYGVNGFFSGNVGIGTTNPGYKLDVSGNVNIGGTGTIGNIPLVSDNNRVLTSSGAGSGTVQYIDTTNWDKDSGDDFGSWWLAGDSGTPQSIGAGDTASFVGGIGIGTTASATDTLTISVDESYGFAWTGAQSWSSTATFNGTLDANGVVTLGDNGENVTIDSNVWDISGAGAGSGFTQFTVDNIDLNGNTIAATNNSGLYLYDNASNGIFIEDGGFVGIGTTNPDSWLHLSGNFSGSVLQLENTGGGGGNFALNVTNDGWPLGGSKLVIRDVGNTANRLVIDSSGYVGIGATSPASLLSVGASSQFQVDSSGDMVKLKNITYSWPSSQAAGDNYVLTNDSAGNLNWESMSGVGGVSGTGASGQVTFWTGASTVSGDDDLWWDNSNKRLGIGTTNPSKKLDVVGNVEVDSGSIYIDDSGNGLVNAAATYGFYPEGYSNILAITTGGATRLAITSGGSVGIGTTNPSQTLEVEGNVEGDIFYIDNEITLTAGSETDPEITWAGDGNNGIFSPTADTIAFTTNGSEKLRINSGGSVGIGTTNPSGKLQVTGDEVRIGSGGTLNYADSDGDLYVQNDLEVDGTIYGAGGTLVSGTGTPNKIPKWNTSSSLTDSVMYDDGTNVGIGTTSPGGYKLNIAGTTMHQNAVYFANGTTYYVDASGNAKFLDLIAADTGNPGLTVGNGTTGYALIGGSTISDAAGNLTLDSDTAYVAVTDDLLITGNDIYDSTPTQRINLGATTTLYNTTTTLSGTTTLTASSLATIDTAASLTIDATSLTLGGSATLYGGTASGGTLTLVSTSNATKGNVQFFSSSNTISSGGNLTIAGNLDVNGTSNDIAGTLNLSGNTLASSGDLTIDPTGGGVKIGTGTPGSIDLAGDDLYVTQDLEVDGTIYGNVSGTIDPDFTPGSVIFAGSSGELAQDNANFFWDDSNNKLGIGTTGPNNPLTVLGGVNVYKGTQQAALSDAHVAITDTGADSRLIIGQDYTNYAELKWVYNATPANAYINLNMPAGQDIAITGGNVGIGTASPDVNLEVAGAIEMSADTGIFYLSRTNVDYGHIGSGNQVVTGSAATDLGVNAVNNMVFGISNVEKMRISSGGNVGIGTTGPGYKLEVSGGNAQFDGIVYFANGTIYYVDASGNAKFLDLIAADTGNPGLTVGNGTTGYAKIGGSTIYDAAGNLTLDSDTAYVAVADDLLITGNDIYDSGTNQRINLGATTTLYNTTTTLSGTTTLTASSLATLTTAAGVSWGGATSLTFTADNATIYGSDVANGNLTLEGTSNGTKTTSYIILQPTGGNVGIGTAGPGYKLDVNGQVYAEGTFDSGTYWAGDAALPGKGFGMSYGSDLGGMMLLHGGTNDEDLVIYWGNDGNGDDLRFMSADWTGSGQQLNDRVIIKGGGNVGIGTTSPGYLLEVSGGNAQFDGIVYFANGTTYYVDASGNAKFLDLIAADTGNPGLTVGNGTTGYAKIGGSTIYDAAGNLTLDSDSNTTYTPDTLSVGGNLTVTGTASFNSAGVTIDSNSYVNAQRFVDIGTSYYLDPAATTTSGLFAGKVGIGEVSPEARLEVASAGNTATSYTARFQSSPSVAGAGGILFDQDGTYSFKMHTQSTGGTGGDLIFSYITQSTGADVTSSILALDGGGDVSVGGNLTVSGTSVSASSATGTFNSLSVNGVSINGTAGRNYFKDTELSTGSGLRVGAAWGMYGIYAESGNVVVGGAGGTANLQNGAATFTSSLATLAGNLTVSGGTINIGADVSLYRGAADRLDLGANDNLRLNESGTGYMDLVADAGNVRIDIINDGAADTALRTYVVGDANPRFRVNAAGILQWGDGTNTYDTNLYRSAANTLKTDDNFVVDADLRVNSEIGIGKDPTPGVYIDANVGTSANFAYFATGNSGTLSFYQDGGEYISIGNTSGKDLRLGAGGSNLIHLDHDGNVGIGTASPNRQLELAHTAADDNNRIRLNSTNTGGYWSGLEFSNATTFKGGLFRYHADDRQAIWSPSTEALTVSSGGNVGIHDVSPATSISILGLPSGGGGYYIACDTDDGDCRYATSSIRHKENIRPFETDFSKILEVEPKRFTYKSGGAEDIGYIAEDIDALGLIDLVMYRDGLPDALRYDKIPLYLVEVAKEQQSQIASLSSQLDDLTLTDAGELQIVGEQQTADGEQQFEVKDKDGNLITRIGAFAEAAIAELRAGLIETKELFVEEKLVSPLVYTEQLEAGSVETEQLTAESIQATESKFGKLISTQIETDELQVNKDATVAGTLYADKVVANEVVGLEGKFGELLAATVSAQKIQGLEERLAQLEAVPSPTPSPEPESPATESEETDPMEDIELSPDIEALVNEILGTSLEATPQAELADASGDNLDIVNNLTVLGATSLADTSIAGSLNVGGTMTLADNSINSLAGTLYLQNLGLGGINILAGKVTIDEQGNAVFEGDITIKGRLALSEIEPLPGQENIVIDLNPEEEQPETESRFGNLLVKGVDDKIVASIDTSGTATFKKLAIAKAEEEVTQISATEIETNATAGEATLPANSTELTIYNSQLTNNSLIYITPVSETQNKVLFVKAKKATTEQEPGWFKVAIDIPIEKDIQFNWWIIENNPSLESQP